MSQLRRSGTRGYAHLVELNVPVARAWKALTDPALIRIWTGAESTIDARQGGSLIYGKPGAGMREAHIDIYEVNRRLRLIYLAGAGLPPGDSAVVDDLLLDVRGGHGSTSLRVLGSGIPEAREWDVAYTRMRTEWERFLGRIKFTLENPPQARKPPAAEKIDPGLPGLDF